MANLRQDQIRELVRTFFQTAMDGYLEKLNDTGFSAQHLQTMETERAVLEGDLDGSTGMSDVFLNSGTISHFRSLSDLSDSQWGENEASFRKELHKARLAQLTAALDAAQSLDRYSFDPSLPERPYPAPQGLSAPLGFAIDDFMTEHSAQLPTKTIKQVRAYLNVLIEYFGPDRLLGSISRSDASDVKKLLQSLPANRKTKPALKHLTLQEAVKAQGQQSISPTTINSHIDAFRRFFVWAELHGHSPHKLFEGLKVPKAKGAATERKPFSIDQTHLILTELTMNPSGIVRKDSHKWGALLGLYTGARLNEICQLEVADVQSSDGTWFLDITDEGDSNKSVKANASRRKVPLHSELIALGFLEFVQTRKSGKRLFPDYSFSSNGGYGRALGRWYNETFLAKLGIKKPSLVFHSLRHTMVTRLAQAGVAEPIIQSIVGHSRGGVTQEVYMREGYKLEQLKEAIECFSV